MLKYLIRMGASSTDLPKVYYCSCPEDMDRHFEKITSEILQKVNCVIWYRDDSGESVDTELLEEMQLVVIPVTYALLSGENEAFEREYKFFMEKHIAILPILCESGLETLYAQKFGNIQYLSRISMDITEISYPEKLEKRLKSALAYDDKTVSRIKNNFDGRIFVSYRKKDRTYARKLMSLIHNNYKLVGYATWYDEFLVPGENFNENIINELKNSDFFSLVVTPNVLEDNNYIITDEYPVAIELEKNVLPFELVSTDSGELSEKFRDIPKSIDAYSPENIEKAFEGLITAAKGSDAKEKSNISYAERQYLLGLAYLTGTDVEVNKPKGAALVKEAADMNLLEGKEKMISIYEMGDGVTADVREAAKYLRELIPYYRKRYEENPTDENAQLWINAVMKSTEVLDIENGYEKTIIGKYTDIADTFEKENKRNFSAAALAGVMLAYVKATEWQIVRNGRKYTSNALWYYRDNCEKSDSTFVQKALAKVYTADADYELHYLFANTNKRAPQFMSNFSSIRNMYVFKGVNDFHNDIRKIAESYNNAYDIVTKLLEKEDSEVLRIERAQINIKKCKALYSLGSFSEAEKIAKSAINVISSADCYSGNAVLGEAYEAAAFSCLLQGKHEEALEFYDKAYNIFFKLAERTKLPYDYSRAYYNSYILLCVALLCRAEGYNNVLENAIRIYDDYLGVAQSEMQEIYEVLCNMKKCALSMDKNASDAEYMNDVLQNVICANGYYLREKAHYFVDRFARRIETCYVIFALSVKLSAFNEENKEQYEHNLKIAVNAFKYLEEFGMISFNMIISLGNNPGIFERYSSVCEFAAAQWKEISELEKKRKCEDIRKKYAALKEKREAFSDKLNLYYECVKANSICNRYKRVLEPIETEIDKYKQAFDFYNGIEEACISYLKSWNTDSEYKEEEVSKIADIFERVLGSDIEVDYKNRNDIAIRLLEALEICRKHLEENAEKLNTLYDESIKLNKEINPILKEFNSKLKGIGNDLSEAADIAYERENAIKTVKDYLYSLDLTADIDELKELTGEDEDYIVQMLKPYAHIEGDKTIYKGEYSRDLMDSEEYKAVKDFLDDYFTDKDEAEYKEIASYFDEYEKVILDYLLYAETSYGFFVGDYRSRNGKIKKIVK